MDQGLIGLVASIVGGVLVMAGVLVLAGAAKARTGVTGETAEAGGTGLYLIYAGLAGIGLGIVLMLAQ